MRTVKFRDVLWSIAYRDGSDPGVDLLKNQSASLVSYINGWVRRLWDQADWPEWTAIYRYAPNPNTHYISWDAMPNDFVPLQRPPEPAAPPWKIGKPLKVYLLDPRTTWAPVDTPFRATERGIHCGFEHGLNVWMKFMPRTPEYTSTEWDVSNSYHIDDLVYWPVTGECYKSKINNNVGHEPDDILLANQSPLNVTETQPYAPPNPGSPEINGISSALPQIVIPLPQGVTGIWRANATRPGFPPPDPTIPPFRGIAFVIQVFDASHVLLATSSIVADGIMTLGQIWAQHVANLTATVPSGFVVRLVGPINLEIEHLSGFTVEATEVISGSTVPLEVIHVQTYVPPPPPIFTDPPPATSVFKMQVLDGSNASLGIATVTANGTDTLATIWASLRTQLLAAPLLSGFAITITDGVLFVEHNSVFSINAIWTYARRAYQIITIQVQAYQPEILPIPSQPQILRLAITEQQVIRNATYTLTFITGDNVEHTVTYIALPTDNAQAILTGLVDAIIAAQPGDPFFAGMTSVLDPVTLSVTFTINVQFGEIGLHATLQPEGTIFWDVIHFPFALMEQVVRGAGADLLAEQGQTDKATTQEQIVPTEQQLRTAGELAPQYQQLTDQTQPRSRYQVK